MQKLLIADHSDVRTEALTKALETKWEIHTCTTSYPVIDAMKYIDPDAMIINLNIGPKDGLSVLNEAFPNLPPVIMAISNFASPYIYDTAESLGVGYLLRMPCDPAYVAARLNDMFDAHLEKPTAIARHLKLLGFDTKLSGYRCLLIAVPLYSNDPQQLLKEIFPDVAKACGLHNAQCVERVIRTAIADAWEHRNKEIWLSYFPANADGDVDLPTNKQFISQLAERI